jgi:hypothetical protein
MDRKSPYGTYGPKQYSIVLITSQSIWNKSYKFIARGLVTERIFSLDFKQGLINLKQMLSNRPFKL